MADELPKEEAERRAQEIARRMLTTPKKPVNSPFRMWSRRSRRK